MGAFKNGAGGDKKILAKNIADAIEIYVTNRKVVVNTVVTTNTGGGTGTGTGTISP